jgi:hypothetical protein
MKTAVRCTAPIFQMGVPEATLVSWQFRMPVSHSSLLTTNSSPPFAPVSSSYQWTIVLQ